MEQFIIVVTGIIAVLLSQSHDYKHRRWSSIAGLAGQPAWLYASYQAGLWGMLIVSIIYTIAWAWGFYKHWIQGNKIEAADC